MPVTFMTTREPQSSAGEPAFGGVPLLQYAAVVAAQGDGFSREDVLAVEGLDTTAWRRAELGFRPLLARGGEPLIRYQDRLVEAEERLARRATPLDEDVDVWARFLAVAAKRKDMSALLHEHGLHPNDLARLGRLWGRRFADDPALAERAAQRVAQPAGSQDALPVLRLEAARLVPSPAARQRAHSATRPAAESAPRAQTPGPELDLDAFARLDAELRTRPAARAVAFARHGLCLARGEAVEREWRERLRGDALLGADCRMRSAHHERLLRLAAESAVAIDASTRTQPSPASVVAATPAAPSAARPAAGAHELSPPLALGVNQTAIVDRHLLGLDALPFRGVEPARPPATPEPQRLPSAQARADSQGPSFDRRNASGRLAGHLGRGRRAPVRACPRTPCDGRDRGDRGACPRFLDAGAVRVALRPLRGVPGVADGGVA
ncbi:MAG: hypothetical protein HY908_36725 [Myxococcales bacterium]|nr:hypothetical protein [Myxococcales bacterium]